MKPEKIFSFIFALAAIRNLDAQDKVPRIEQYKEKNGTLYFCTQQSGNKGIVATFTDSNERSGEEDRIVVTEIQDGHATQVLSMHLKAIGKEAGIAILKEHCGAGRQLTR